MRRLWLGKVIEGMDVVNKIEKVQTGATACTDVPSEPVVIKSRLWSLQVRRNNARLATVVCVDNMAAGISRAAGWSIRNAGAQQFAFAGTPEDA